MRRADIHKSPLETPLYAPHPIFCHAPLWDGVPEGFGLAHPASGGRHARSRRQGERRKERECDGREKRLYHRRAQEALSLRRRRAPRDQGVRLVGTGMPPGVRGPFVHRRRRPARQGGGRPGKPLQPGAPVRPLPRLARGRLLAGPHPAPLEARPRKSRQGPVGAGGLGRGARRDRRDTPGPGATSGSTSRACAGGSTAPTSCS